MAIAGLNQEDIFDAIVGRITQRESKETKEMEQMTISSRNFLLMINNMIELGMSDSKPFKTLMARYKETI